MILLTGRVVNTSGIVAEAQARALRSAGVRGVVRVIGLPERSARYDLSPGELAMLHRVGLPVGIYAQWRASGHTADTGAADAARVLTLLEALEWPADVPCFLDLECVDPPSPADGLAYARAWAAAFAAAGRVCAAYLDRTWPLGDTWPELREMFGAWWRAGSRPTVTPASAWVLEQSDRQTTIAGLPVNEDIAHGAPMLGPPGLERLSGAFTPRVGESLGGLVQRVLEGLDGAAPGDSSLLYWLAERVEGAAAGQEQYRTTNCATSARWVLAWLGCTHPLCTAPDREARQRDPAGPISWLLTIARDCGALIDCRGWSREHIEREMGHGWLLYLTGPEHVEWCLDRDVADPEPDEHGGGGRARNRITVGRGDLVPRLACMIDTGRLVPFAVRSAPAEIPRVPPLIPLERDTLPSPEPEGAGE